MKLIKRYMSGGTLMARVLFLDIDGVLNSELWNNSHQREISDGTLIDEEKINMLAYLIKRTDAQIILHSGWRIWFDNEMKPSRMEAKRLIKLLEKHGVELKGLTPDLTTEEIRKSKKFSLVKADEILAYLKSHNNVTEWVVLDDLDLHNVIIEQHQVKPDQATGLTREDIEKAEKILLGRSDIKDTF